MLNPKSSIPIGEKVEIIPKGFPLGVKAEREKKKTFSICPKLLINAELYGLVLAPLTLFFIFPISPPKAQKRVPSNLGGQCATPGAHATAFINILTSRF
jgi:hypothetical protein